MFFEPLLEGMRVTVGLTTSKFRTIINPMDDAQIRGMRDDDWPLVFELIELEWEANHPVLSRDFFFWQHQGFGPASNCSTTPLAFMNGELIGMRGIIPGEYQLPRATGGYEYTVGGAFAMWIVAKKMRGRGIGAQLLQHCEANLPVMVALGSNEKTSVPIYRKNGFSRLDALSHWFVLLTESARGLVFGPEAVVPIFRPDSGLNRTHISVTTDAKQLASLWTQFSARVPLFSLRRTEEFWNWRYLEHPVFDYEVLHDPTLGIALVHRIDEIATESGQIRVMRIVELVVGKPEKDDLTFDRTTEIFLSAVLQQKLAQGVDAVDFRISSTLFDVGLSAAGFLLSSQGVPDASNWGFAGRLEPLLVAPSPINLHWKLGSREDFDFSSPYFTKSDSDMDRPNARGQRSDRLSL